MALWSWWKSNLEEIIVKNTIYGWALTITSAWLMECLCFWVLLYKGLGLGFTCPRPLAAWWGSSALLNLIFHSRTFHGLCAPLPCGGWRIQPLKKPLKSSSRPVFLFTQSNIVSWCSADVKSLLSDVPRGRSLLLLASWGVWAWHNWGWKSFSHLFHSLWDFTASSDQRGFSSVPVVQRMNLDCCAAHQPLVLCVTKGTCPCPALSRALGGCTHTHTQEQLNTRVMLAQGGSDHLGVEL